MEIVLSNRAIPFEDGPVRDEKATSREWLENWMKNNGGGRTVEKRCGNCHYFRKLDNPKAFAEDEGQCCSPWQERDTRSADQTCENWAEREPERLAMPPSKRKRRREPYAFKPEGGQQHGHLRFRRARARY